MKKEELILGNQQIKKSELDFLREKFVNEYSKKKGWNPNELTTSQLLEITKQKGYKNPGIILG